MICLNCKKQIPDDSTQCPFCGKEIIGQEQLPKEISFRRYQRWFFYALIILIFVGMVFIIVKAYNANTKLLLNITNVAEELSQAKEELKLTEDDLGKKDELIKEVQTNLLARNKEVEELQGKTDEFKKVLDEKVVVEEKYSQSQLDLSSAEANIYNLIIKLGVGITNNDLAKIPIADANLGGDDADADGLSDAAEAALGTDPARADTDGDGYSDKDEILAGFNPAGEGSLGIDYDFANRQKGKIFLQVEANGEAWYVNPGDGKRYFLGRPADGFRVMRDIEYWTRKD